MRSDDLIRLRHMYDAACEAISYGSGRRREDVALDRMLLHSFVRRLEVIGEAAAHISIETQAELPTLPWTDMIGMRNRLIYAYADINPDIV